MPWPAVRDVPVLWVTGTGVCAEPARSTQRKILRYRGRRAHTVLDLDYRPMFWSSRESARREAAAALQHVTIAVGNLDETLTATGETDPRRAGLALLAAGIELAVIKQGPAGVLGMTADEEVTVPPVPVSVLNGLGANERVNPGDQVKIVVE